MRSTAFFNANVVDLDNGSVVPDRVVLARDGTIATIAPASGYAVPEDAEIIDARAKYLLPGFADMHVHIAPHAPVEGLSEEETLDRVEHYLTAFLVSGVTTVRNMAGTPLHLHVRGAVAEGKMRGPRILTCGPILETRFTFPELAEIGTLVTTTVEARAEVIRQKQAGFDYVKVYNDLEADIYDEIVRTAREIGIPVVGHVAFQKGLDGALAARQDSIEHLRSYDFAADTRAGDVPFARYEGWLHTTPQRIEELAERTAEAGVWNAPTMVIEHGIRTDAEMAKPHGDFSRFIPDWLRKELKANDLEGFFTSEQREALAKGRGARGAMVAALDKLGAGLLAGSDCPGCRLEPGRSLLTEIELMVEAGLAEWRALRTATANAATFLGEDGEGLVREGNRADLLLLDENPLDDIGAIHKQAGVMVSGRWHARGEIEAQLLSA